MQVRLANRLWSTDFDGTLYAGARSDAVLSASIIECIANWIINDGCFHVLTGGSMAGLVRDGFDLVGQVHGQLQKRGVTDPAALVCSGMSFSTSNGVEHYHVLDPKADPGPAQVSFRAMNSHWVSRENACRFIDLAGKMYGMSSLAVDHPVGGHPDHVVALFLARTALQTCRQQDVDAMNAELLAMGSTLHLVFVRESQTPEGFRQRFDAFPRVCGDLSKCYAARRVFAGYSKVVYTGDQPQGNDRSVFDWTRAQPGMESYSVEGPDQVVEIINRL